MLERGDLILKVLDAPEEMAQVEALQRLVWPGSETDIVPAHLLLTVARNGGLVVGAFRDERLVGFVFGFLGMTHNPAKPALKHCSHMLGVHPDYRDLGVGFKLKRAQWQMVRKQKLELITWTYDPLISRNAYLNLAKLGAVCSTYERETYGEMRDGLNVGLPSDRFQVDWWVNSDRANRRLSRTPRRRLDLAHFLAAGAEAINPTSLSEAGWPQPPDAPLSLPGDQGEWPRLLLVEIPSSFLTLKEASPDLALKWRLHTRPIFEDLFSRGYLATDFVYLPGTHPRSYYVLSRGDTTLGD